MDDLISRQAAIDEMGYCQTYLFDTRDTDKKISLEDAINALEQLPSAQPERKKGKWKRKIVDNGFNANWKCSGCGFEVMLESVYNFCPNCGADMRGEQDE